MRRRQFIAKAIAGTATAVAGGLSLPKVLGAESAVSDFSLRSLQRLHNGILLPDPFPPVLTEFLDGSTSPYYLLSPPSTILINVGRQLFVDDFLIESIHNLAHTFHRAEVHPEPLVSPGDDEASTFVRDSGLTVVSYFAAPYSDGVWWDAYQRRFRAWLLSGQNALKLAESDDGIEWHRATLGNGSEIIMEVPQGRDSGAVWIDFQTDDESARYKMSHFNFTDKKNWLYTSRDGLEWPSYWDPAARTAHYSSKPDVPTGDRTTFFHDPFREKC